MPISGQPDQAGIRPWTVSCTTTGVVADSTSLLGRVEDATQLIAVDEAQFFDRGIVEVADGLANQGRRVIVAELDQGYLGRPFRPMPGRMAIAEDVTKVRRALGD